ncbi:MAG TPA: CHAT domain-containing protein [Thermoanaerobaculia bacterium]
MRFAPLLILLLFAGEAAAQVSSEKAYRSARDALDKGSLNAAAEQTEKALARAGAAQDQWTAALRVLQAELLSRRGYHAEARALLEPELPAALRKTEAAVWRLIALGYASPENQRRDFLEAAHKLATASQPPLLYRTHLALANAIPGHEGERHLRAALELAQRGGNLLGIAAVNSAFLLRFTAESRYAEAIDVGEPALATFRALRVTSRIYNTAGNLGWAYLLLGDWERALELFEEAEAAAARAQADAPRVTWLNQLGNVHFAEERFERAAHYYTRALSHARALKESKEAPFILTNLARTALESGRHADARNYLTQAQAAGGNEDQRLRMRILEARLAMLGGDRSRAEQTLRDVATKAKKGSETRLSAVGHLAQQLARMQRNDEAEKQFREAVDLVQAERTEIENPELRLSFFNVSSYVFNSYIRFLVRNKRYEDALAVTELIRAQSLEEGLKMAAAPRKLDARTIARERRATILSYWLDRDGSHLWVVTAGGVRYVPLPPAISIRHAAGAYRRNLTSSRYGSLQQSGAAGEQLYRTLVEPAGIAKGTRVVVIADGILHALNFETLVVPAPRRHYWIEDAVVSSAGSLQLLARDEAKKSPGGSMLLVGDPPSADAAFPKLKFAKQEIRSVGRHFERRTVLDGPKATPAAYRAATPGRFDYVHFVAHGVSSRLRPLDSAVILGPDASRQYKLYARDILEQRLEARLVTISSCYGAGERTFTGEGLVGLAWAFLRAGANEVIAALWEVNDDATPKLMDQMYAGIRAGRDPAVALRDAKLVLLRGKGTYQNARYWAPFVLYSGD